MKKKKRNDNSNYFFNTLQWNNLVQNFIILLIGSQQFIFLHIFKFNFDKFTSTS